MRETKAQKDEGCYLRYMGFSPRSTLPALCPAACKTKVVDVTRPLDPLRKSVESMAWSLGPRAGAKPRTTVLKVVPGRTHTCCLFSCDSMGSTGPHTQGLEWPVPALASRGQ